MTVQQINSNISDDSDDMVSLPSEEDICRRKYQLLLERCEVLQQDNERIVNRIHEVKRITKRYKKDIKLLVERLDKHGDPFRTTAVEVDVKPEVTSRVARPVTKAQPIQRNTEKQNTTGGKKTGTKRKSKADKPERDPNAPKKPCNAFFQFCQEQRPLVVAETATEMGLEPSKQEITRQLASRWRNLTNEEKRVYVAMFERSKEKYVEEMSAYIKKEQ
ncbi:High mobility group-T protein [Papilio machaon]|uniref:High mobility group-T protein n=1 Tax=Papilio machaon TaxID=76193 RepID=A0A194QV30_PAPMA|nr:non-histone protein 10 [Papilio machaon]KPJ08835.1 High mobility group-T protein [Papilio machaon]